MTDRRRFLGGATALGALLLTGCEKAQQTMDAAGVLLNQGKGSKRFPTYRYRLTVTVDTPEGVKSGSSVIEVKTALGGPNNIPSPGSLYMEARGEAVAVDLGKRGVLFALLGTDWAAGALLSTVPALTQEELRNLPEDQDEFSPRFNRMMALPMEQPQPLPRYVKNSVAPVPTSGPPNGYPMLVRFRDITEPASVERVDPDNLANTFGDGVTLKAITVTRSNAPVTKGIANRLPWLRNLNGGLVKVRPQDVVAGPQPLATTLHDGDFSYGVEK